MVQNEAGDVLTDIKQLEIGQRITMNFADGLAEADIIGIEEKKE